MEAPLPSQRRVPFTTRDGRRLVIRRIRQDDAGLLQELHRRNSPETRRLRFFSAMPELDDDRAERFAAVDFRQRAAFVATCEGEESIRAVARYEAVDAETVEIAFVIEDHLQGQGLGSALFPVLAEHARSQGYSRLKATTLAENRAMLRVFEKNAQILDIERDGSMLKVLMRAEAA